MSSRRTILVVTGGATLAPTLYEWLGEDYDLSVVTTFGAARSHLDRRPDVMLTEVKLGAYNGLHLALRAWTLGIPTVVVGDPDPVVQNDAEQFGARYISVTGLSCEALLVALDSLCHVAPTDLANMPTSASPA